MLNYIPRVTQLDALQLDEEVVELFKGQLLEATKFFSPGLLTPILPEMNLALRALLFKFSVVDKHSTFGHQMLSLKYDENLISKGKLFWLFGYSIGAHYLRERGQYSFTSNSKIQRFLSALEHFQLMGDIINFVRFLQSGKCPRFVEYLLNLDITAEKVTREDLSDISWTRELLWNNFIELFGTLLSLGHMFDLRTKLKGISKFSLWKKKMTRNKISPDLSINTLCAVCDRRPVLPYHMECAHVFCYYCLKANKLADSNFECTKCDNNGQNIFPVSIR